MKPTTRTYPDRRSFLALAAGCVAGCGQKPPATNPPTGEPSAELQNWLARQKTLAQKFGVPAGSTRTTPPPPFPVTDPFPELKPLMKLTVRLHPRAPVTHDPAFDTDLTVSRIGGRLARPTTPVAGLSGFIPVLQLRVEDAPPHLRFEANTDLMQVYWQPPGDSVGVPRVRVVFISREGVVGGTAPIPEGLPLAWVPFPCRVFPERVAEYPSPYLMPKMMRERIAAWKPPGSSQSGTEYFVHQLGPAPGTKVGGWPRILGEPDTPTCEQCHRLMDFLMTVDTREWDDSTASRWRPREERDSADGSGYQSALGFDWGNGRRALHLYLCNTCPDRPATGKFRAT